MDRANEAYRVRHFSSGEEPPSLYDAIEIACDDLTNCIEKVRSVVEIVARHDPVDWPTDGAWAKLLPEWFLRSFSDYVSPTSCESEPALRRASAENWTLGSWVVSARDRDWAWWSIERGPSTATIFIALEGYPYGGGALRHLIAAAGGTRVHPPN
jgi:hypothetical protein